MRTATFFTINKKLRNAKSETQKKTKVCLSYQQSIGLFGANCYLCQYSLFFEPPAKKWKIAKKILFGKLAFPQ